MRRWTVIIILALTFIATAHGQTPNNVIIEGNTYRCTSSINIDLLRVTNPGPTRDALQLGPNCTGTIQRIELSGLMADGIKVQNSAPVAHDLTINGGFVFCGQPASGVHQDGMQAMGGLRITFNNLVINCLGGGGGNYFPARGGAGASTPTDVVCNNCAFGPLHPNNIQIQTSVRSGIRDSLVCRPLSGRNPITIGSTAQNPINVNSIIVDSNDASCTNEGLVGYVGGSEPPSPPPPPPPPPPSLPAPALTICAEYTATMYFCWPMLANVTRYVFEVDGTEVSSSNNSTLTRVRFGKQVGTHSYCVVAVYTEGVGRSCITKTR